MIKQLILKMSQAEKRHFTLQANSFKKAPEHVRLFKFIAQKDLGVENDLLDFEKGYEGNTAALKKRYLKSSILDSLRSFNKNKTVGRIIMNHIQDAETLYHKLLYREAMKTLSKARKLAIKHERFGLHLEIINWERRLIGSTLEDYSISEKDLDTEEEEIHKKNDNELWARKLQASISEFKKKHGFLTKDGINLLYEQIPRSTFHPIQKMNSKRGAFYYSWVLALYYSMTSEHDISYQITKKIDDRYIDVVDPEDLFFAMLEHLTSCIYTHQYEEVLKRLEALRKLKDEVKFRNNIIIEERYFYYASNYSILSNTAIGNDKGLREIMLRVTNELPLKRDNISDQMLRVLKSSLAQGFLALGEYQKSKAICRELLNLPKSQVRKDVLNAARMLYIINVFELKEFELLESELSSTLKYFSNNSSVKNLEYLICFQIKHFLENRVENELELAQNITNQITSFFKKDSIKFDQLLYLMWAKTKLYGNKNALAEFKKWYI